MALINRRISTAPGTRPDPRHETAYQPSRGGHFRAASEMTCCGQPMKTEGDKQVCGSCGSWFLAAFLAAVTG
ncbi:hypothetical protein ACFXCZ_35435 [Streptomyces sp. NPDC059396]|uniref:hypothetical protein n=1 Tax=Streptomyces sp. NPDC059396 TaxID=3346819 RepID=UPI003697B6B4